MVDRGLLQDVNDGNNDANDQAFRRNDVPNLWDLLNAQDGLETLQIEQTNSHKSDTTGKHHIHGKNKLVPSGRNLNLSSKLF